MKMRKAVVAIAAISLLTLMTIPTFGSIGTGDNAPKWLGTLVPTDVVDPYYNQAVIGYRTGTTAVVKILVTNTEGILNPVNITKVWITFDWGSSYVSTQVNATNWIHLENGASYLFFINFTVPSTSVASNLYTHYYTITANFTGGHPPYTSSGSNFAVFSADQADAVNLRNIYNTFPSFEFTNMSAQAEILLNQAANESATASRYYQAGNFAAAKQSWSNAVNDKNNALSAEQSYLTMIQDLQIQQIQSGIRATDAMTSFFNGLSTMWVLFGIGWVLLGIGYIVKHLRTKREAPAA